MNQSTVLCSIPLAFVLFGCQPEGSNGDNQGSTDVDFKASHNVCNFDDDDEIVANDPIDQRSELTLIQSATAAAGSIELAEDDVTGAFAVIAFLAPSLSDGFMSFLTVYACTEESYAKNQCNYDVPANLNGGVPVRVRTVVSSGDHYQTVVEMDEGSGYQTDLVVSGTIGDFGNLTFEIYDDGVLSSTRTSSRTASGSEEVVLTSASENWTMQETAGCSGSLEYDGTKNGDTVTVDATWSFNGSSMSGSLEYFKTGMDAVYTLNF
ncbi:hypothetical protein [Reinekea blandensis]|uniref:Uncharacterized protein n=1 Tax=Reinekea blandensis MED297 TaxID=314283 RepID=A4BII9_9GAMM|nr:hypothetical protein [Reinekea blandensis]EAR08068.1 hypothetical protein MED297_07491 [Reinekea sp. MED297] [Reinekea blandensis MED297]